MSPGHLKGIRACMGICTTSPCKTASLLWGSGLGCAQSRGIFTELIALSPHLVSPLLFSRVDSCVQPGSPQRGLQGFSPLEI